MSRDWYGNALSAPTHMHAIRAPVTNRKHCITDYYVIVCIRSVCIYVLFSSYGPFPLFNTYNYKKESTCRQGKGVTFGTCPGFCNLSQI